VASPVSPSLLWAGIVAILALCLGVDLWVHRRAREVTARSAIRWTAAWIGVAGCCAAAIWLLLGTDHLLQFTASYAVEWLLSVDNVFVFVLLLASLAVPRHLRYRVLFLGILGAIALRTGFILAGSALLARFDWLSYVFGVLLLLAAARIGLGQGQTGQALDSGLGRLLRRWLPTPLLLAVVLVAVTDVVFATDSVPAVLAMTRDPLLAFSSNALAVTGLRSLYFLLEAAMVSFRFLQPALVILLAFVASKMLAAPVFDVPVVVTLAVIATVLGGAVLASWALPPAPAPGDG